MTTGYEDLIPGYSDLIPKQQVPEEPKSFLDQGIDFLTAATRFTPQSLMMKVNEVSNSLLDKAAYETGGLATDLTMKAGAPPELAAGVGTGVNAAIQSLPGIAAGITASPTMEHWARNLIQSSIKPSSKDVLSGKANRAITTILKEGISPTPSGMERLRAMGNAQNAKVAELIKKTGGTIDKTAAANRIQDVVSSIEKLHPTPQEALPAVEKVYTRFLKNDLLPKNIPVERAQAVKQEIYRMLKYGELTPDLPKEAAFKALGRGLKEELEKSVPGVKALNARASDLWNALNVSERRALMHLNNNPLNVGLLTHSKETFAMFMADKSPTFKALFAKILYGGRESLPAALGGTGGALYNYIRHQDGRSS